MSYFLCAYYFYFLRAGNKTRKNNSDISATEYDLQQISIADYFKCV
jgi:hypothetical protein